MAGQAEKLNFSWATALVLCIQSLCCPGLLLPSALLTVGLCDMGQCSPERPALNELFWLLGAVTIVLTQHLTCVNLPFWETTCIAQQALCWHSYFVCTPRTTLSIFLQAMEKYSYTIGTQDTLYVPGYCERQSVFLHGLKIIHLLCLFQNTFGLLMFWPMFFQHILNSEQCM